jgi:hypothetical protein
MLLADKAQLHRLALSFAHAQRNGGSLRRRLGLSPERLQERQDA